MDGLTYDNCRLCPRQCGVNRNVSAGFCGEKSELFAARASLHLWEEPVVSGSQGSGTVFFRGCNLKCVYCQNYSIAHNKGGKPISSSRLAEIYIALQNKGAHNINLVTPTHFLPHVTSSVAAARRIGLTIPIVYNTGGYERVEAVKTLKDTVDIYLTDFKYFTSETAEKYSHASDYFSFASDALDEMVSQNPKPVIENGLMKKGVIIRHLLLPGHLIESKLLLKYLFQKYGNSVFYSLMNQYTPVRQIEAYPNLNRTVTMREYNSLISYASRLGITNAFIQEGGTQKDSFIPAFDLSGL